MTENDSKWHKMSEKNIANKWYFMNLVLNKIGSKQSSDLFLLHNTNHTKQPGFIKAQYSSV